MATVVAIISNLKIVTSNSNLSFNGKTAEAGNRGKWGLQFLAVLIGKNSEKKSQQRWKRTFLNVNDLMIEIECLV